jgi:poly(A) polymerase Pap1
MTAEPTRQIAQVRPLCSEIIPSSYSYVPRISGKGQTIPIDIISRLSVMNKHKFFTIDNHAVLRNRDRKLSFRLGMVVLPMDHFMGE